MIEIHRHGRVAELILANPPVNALSTALRTSLADALEAALADDAIDAIVIRGKGKLFSGGADITEFDALAEAAALQLPELIDRIERSPKPVVGAIHGMALGGGLEVALGCHYRIATPDARMGLPEVKLGLLPGAGGTQRLPRLVGVPMALMMIISGAPISAAKALDIGLVDKLVQDEELGREAITFAAGLTGVRRTSDLSATADDSVFDDFIKENARKINGLDAPLACIEAIRAATLLPYAEGVVRERELFNTLLAGKQSQALRHIFLAERRAAKIDELPRDIALRDIKRVGMIGFGTMGVGIAMNFLNAGMPVTVVEVRQDALDRGLGTARKTYEASAAKGRINAADVEQAMALITPTIDFAALADCDLVIEAVYEDMAVKKEIFRRLDAVAKPGAVLATNTSFLDVNEIAAVTSRPADVLGLHFFSPANVMQLVEVIRGEHTAPDALATAMAISRKIGKVPVVSGVCPGFIGNRILGVRQAQANALLLEGATPEQIDRVHTAFGMPMGPFQMADLAGVDIGWHRDSARIESLQDALCAQGRWGQKTGAGFYDYDERRKPSTSPVTLRIIEDFRARTREAPREISDEEITVRTLYTMISEGLRILDEGIAQRASDIDVVWVFGYGWPAVRGGPMFWGEQIGHAVIADGLRRYRDRLPPDFKLAPLLSPIPEPVR